MTLFNFFYALFNTIYIFLSFKLFIKPKKRNPMQILFYIFIFTLLNFINYTYAKNTIELAFHSILNLVFIIFEFSESITNILRLYIKIFLINFGFELLFHSTFFLLKLNAPTPFILNLFTSILTIIFLITFKGYIQEKFQNTFLNRERNKIRKYIFINFISTLIVFFRVPEYRSSFSLDKLITLLLFLIILNLIVILFSTKEKKEVLNKNYNKIVEYSSFTERLLTEYKSAIHEYKNQLIIIKSLIGTKNKKVHHYIDNILGDKKVDNFKWLMEIKSIPIAGVKGLINFKLLKMKELNIEVEFYISNDVTDISEDFLATEEKDDLYTILGIILDNAIEASLESEEKMISLQLYKEENFLVIMLANTFKSINISRMDEKGFSSKGNNRGIGLYLLNEILKKDKKFLKETNVINNFFVQKIKINYTK